jgi:hypothetical protein
MRNMRQTYLENLYRKKKMQTHAHTSDFIEKILRKRKEKKERFIFKKNPFDLLVMYS